MPLGISPYYDGTNTYITRQENDNDVYRNVVMVAIPNRCLTSTTPENAHLTKKEVQEVCELTSGSILARVNYV